MSERVIEATASGVTHRQLRRKSDGREFTLYQVETDQGEFTTAKRDLAEQAQRVLNTRARFVVKEEKRGEFTNLYLEQIEQLSNGDPGHVRGAEQTIGQPSLPSQTSDPSGKDTYIFRQTAAKVSAIISKTPDEFWQNAVDLVEFFTDGKNPLASKADESVAEAEDDGIPF